MKEQIEKQAIEDVVPRAEGGAECPACHGTGRIGTTDWLTKHMTAKELAKEKAKAIAEHEAHLKTEVAAKILAEIESVAAREIDEYTGEGIWCIYAQDYAELKKKYTEGSDERAE